VQDKQEAEIASQAFEPTKTRFRFSEEEKKAKTLNQRKRDERANSHTRAVVAFSEGCSLDNDELSSIKDTVPSLPPQTMLPPFSWTFMQRRPLSDTYSTRQTIELLHQARTGGRQKGKTRYQRRLCMQYNKYTFNEYVGSRCLSNKSQTWRCDEAVDVKNTAGLEGLQQPSVM
jgi:hypothetical protein